MKALTCFILLTGLFLAGCQKEEPEKAKIPTSSENPLDAPGRYGGALVQGRNKAVQVAGLASINQAVKMFYTQEGRYPKSLQELVSPDYLPKLPPAPNGKKYDYNPKTGAVKLVAK